MAGLSYLFMVMTVILCIYYPVTPNKVSTSLAEKVSHLNELATRRPIIRLDNEKFSSYARTAPRNYSMVVMFTALRSQRSCAVCKDAYDEFQILANSYYYQRNDQLFLAMVDYDEAQGAFQSMKLQSAPVFIHFPSKGGPKKSDTFAIQQYGFHAEVLARYIVDATGVSINVVRPPNYLLNVVMLLTVVLVGGLIYLKRDSMHFLFERRTWALIICCFIVFMMSGQMWNKIRGAGLAGRDQSGTILIAPSSQSQYVGETYIVMMLHAAVSAGFIIMNSAFDQKSSNAMSIVAAVGLGMTVFFFSTIYAIFRQKYQGYPYRMFF